MEVFLSNWHLQVLDRCSRLRVIETIKAFIEVIKLQQCQYNQFIVREIYDRNGGNCSRIYGNV